MNERISTRSATCRWISSISLLLLSFTASCSSGPGTFTWTPKEPISWPAGAAVPRVSLELAYHGTDDAHRSGGFWAGLSSFVFGSSQHALSSPNGLALAKDKFLFIADSSQGALHRLDLLTCEHEIYRGPDDNRLISPIGACFDGTNRIYVTDSVRNRVFVFALDGTLIESFGDEQSIGRPTGIAYDADRKRLLILDTTGSRLLVCSPDGKTIKSVGTRGSSQGEFNFPTYLCVGPDGKVYVTDSLNFRIQIFSPELEVLSQIGGPGRGPGTFMSPKGVAVDSQSHVYVVDGMFGNVQVFSPSGQLLLVVSSAGSGLGQLYLPTGLLIDGKDRIFVSDSGNARIQILQFHALDNGDDNEKAQ